MWKMETLEERAKELNSEIDTRIDENGVYFAIPKRKRFCILTASNDSWEIDSQYTIQSRRNGGVYKVLELKYYQILVDGPRTEALRVIPFLHPHPFYPYKK